jgi:hypothetical protein
MNHLLRRSNFFNFSRHVKTQDAHNFQFAKDIPESLTRAHMNLFQSVNSAIDIALEKDSTYNINFN